jgi:hypothetical protein
MNYYSYQPMMRNGYHHHGKNPRYFPVLPFLAGLAVSPFIFGGYGRPNYGPNFGPNYGPNYGPGYGPQFGPSYGPQFGPNYGYQQQPYYKW